MRIYKKSDKCELVYTPIAWNVLDIEQRADLDFLNLFPNRAGKIRECVRAVRTGQGIHVPITLPDGNAQIDQFEEVSELDALKQLLDD